MNNEDIAPIPCFITAPIITTPIHAIDNNQSLTPSSQISLPSTSNSVIVTSGSPNTFVMPTIFQNKYTAPATHSQSLDGNTNTLPNYIIFQNPTYQTHTPNKNTLGQMPPVMLTGKIGSAYIGASVLDWVRSLQHLFEKNPEWDTEKQLQVARDATNPSQGTAFALTRPHFKDWSQMKRYVAKMLDQITMDAYMIAIQLGAIRWRIESEKFEVYTERFIRAVERILKEEVHDIPDLLSGAKWQILANIPSIRFQGEIYMGVPGMVKQVCSDITELKLYADVLQSSIKSSEAPLIKWYLNLNNN